MNDNIKNFCDILVTRSCSKSDATLMRKLIEFKPTIDALRALGVPPILLAKFILKTNRMGYIANNYSVKMLGLIQAENLTDVNILIFLDYFFNCSKRNYLTLLRQEVSVKGFVKLATKIDYTKNINKNCPMNLVRLKGVFYKLLGSTREQQPTWVKEINHQLNKLSDEELKFYFEARIPNYRKFTNNEVVRHKIYSLLQNYHRYGVPTSLELRV